MRRADAVFTAAIVVVIVCVSSYLVITDDDVTTVDAGHTDVHPRINIEPYGMTGSSETGNLVDVRLYLVVSDDGWHISYMTSFDVGDGYEIDSLTITTSAPESASIVHYNPTAPDVDGLVFGNGFRVGSEFGSEEGRTVFRFDGSYRDEGVTVSNPTIGFLSNGSEGPIECTFTARFEEKGLFANGVELITGSISVWPDQYVQTVVL